MPKDLTAPYRMPLLPARSSGPPVAALAAHDATLALSFFPALYYWSFSGTKGRALTLSAFRSRESTDLGLDDMSQPPAHGNGAVQNAIPVKVEDTPPPQDHILQGNLQTRHQPATPAALGFNANRREAEDNIRIACATAAAVNGAIADGSGFVPEDDKAGTSTVLKSSVVNPPPAAGEPATAGRTRTGSRAKPAPASKRAKTGGKKTTGGSDNTSSGSATSKPLVPGETTNELANIHNLQPAATPNREPELALGHNGKQRSSQYRGVTKHKRSGRWEAHIWVKETGKQMYLGGYEKEEHAAEAYDVAAMKCKGTKGARKVKLNFPASKYSELDSFMQSVGLEELVMAIRRQSQGFARGSSGFRGVTHHPNGRWEARIGMPGSKHIYLGLYNEEAAAAKAYDRALVRLRGAAAATNYSLTNYKDELQAFEMDKSTETLACSTAAEAVLRLPAAPEPAVPGKTVKSPITPETR